MLDKINEETKQKDAIALKIRKYVACLLVVQILKLLNQRDCVRMTSYDNNSRLFIAIFTTQCTEISGFLSLVVFTRCYLEKLITPFHLSIHLSPPLSYS